MSFLRFNPDILLSVKNPQTTMVFLAIIASKYPQFSLVKGCSVILNFYYVLLGLAACN